MTSETIWQRMRRRSFQAFKLNTSDGESYGIGHPEMIYVSKNSVVVA